MYAVGGRSNATGISVDACIGALWNPHATKQITVVLATFSKVVGGAGQYIQRISALGTSTANVTPDIDNDLERLAAPVSGAVLHLGFSVEPTRAAPDLAKFLGQNNPGVTFEHYFGDDGLAVPAGTGVGLFNLQSGTATQFDLSFVWHEGDD